jgi:uncharacterized protein YbaA (DUF1428 family)
MMQSGKPPFDAQRKVFGGFKAIVQAYLA